MKRYGMHRISGGKSKQVIAEAENNKTPAEPTKRFKPRQCIALVSRSVRLCAKDYKFVEGKEYIIDEWEVFTKLTNPLNPVLKEKT